MSKQTQPAADTADVAGYPFAVVDTILDSPRNPRKHFDPAKMVDLENNVKGVGRILSPILVRPFPKRAGFWETLAGHRRMKVARKLKLTAVPYVNLGDISDDMALEILLIENLHHEDVLPLEEAAGYEELSKLKGYTLELIAQKVSKPIGYITRMLKLLSLTAPLKKLFLEGELNISHAHVLCRLSAADQAKVPLFEEKNVWSPEQRDNIRTKVARSAREIRAWIRANLLLSLSDAPWKKDDPLLVAKAGSCTACPKRTGNQVALWEEDGLKPGDDRCLDGACYAEKREAFIQMTIAGAKEKVGVDLIRVATDHMDWGAVSRNKGVLDHYSYKKVEGKKGCDAMEAAIVVYGSGTGQQINICRQPKCPVHAQHRSGAPAKVETPAELWKKKAEALEVKLRLEVAQACFRELLIEGPKVYKRPELTTVLAFLVEQAHHEALSAAVTALQAAASPTPGARNDFPNGKITDPQEAILKWAKTLDEGGVARLIYGLCFAEGLYQPPYQKNPDKELLAAAAAYKVDVKGIGKSIRTQALKAFEERKATALAKVKTMKTKVKKAKAARA